MTQKIRPISVNTDIDALEMKGIEARFIKGYRIDANANGNLPTGTGSGAPSGANFSVRTKLQSNKEVIPTGNILPVGRNKKVGGYYSELTNEFYYFNFNKLGSHGIYVIDGDTMFTQKVLVDPELRFSSNPLYEIPPHCVELWIVYDSDDVATRKIKEKYLVWTDSKNWQGWLNVIASIKTNGFDATVFPYWTLKQPHFDRRELFEWAVRPIMPAPVITPVPLTDADKGKHNGLLQKSFQFAVEEFYTDGRPTTLSQWSDPFFVTKSSCNINSQNLTRCIDIKFHAGSAMTERIRILFKNCDGDWRAVETIDKFTTCNENDPAVIGNEYWLRQNPWKDYQYDPVFNTIVYRFCNDKECKLVSQVDANRLQSDMPILSTAVTAVGNNMMLVDNLLGYPNLPCETLKNIKVDVEKVVDTTACDVKTRKVTIYAFVGRDGNANQVGYKMTNETPVRFGGIAYSPASPLSVEPDEADMFGLNFGDKQGPLMYLAGTPYYAIGKQYKVNSDFTKELVGIFDFNLQQDKDLVNSIWHAGGFFVWQFEFVVPADKYIARLAGHGAKETDDYAKTSTFCTGIANSRTKSAAGPYIFSTVTSAKEIEIDCCNDDLDLWGNGKDTFFMYVPYDYKEGSNKRWRFITGNVWENSIDKVPVELVRYTANQGFPNYLRNGYFTDHNGFYFQFTARGDAKKANVEFWSKFNCYVHDQNSHIAATSGLPSKERGYYPDTNIFLNDFNGGKFGDCNRILVRGKVTECDGVTGLSGVNVTITRGGNAITASDGTFELIVHNSFEQIRLDRIYFNTGGECLFSTCNCLCSVLENYTDAIVPCNNCTERVYPVPIARSYKLSIKSLKSLKGGGRYATYANVWDLAGRTGFLNLLGYNDIPTFLETGEFAQHFLRATITGPLKLNSSIKWISFFRSKNLNYTSYLQWVGDKIEFLNTRGEIVDSPSSAVRARVIIQSLNEFNKAQTFGNTTSYQFVQGDKLRVYDDGNGNLFPPATNNGFLDYEILGTNWNQANEDLGVVETTITSGSTAVKTSVPVEDGKSFIIPFDKRLIALQKTCGFWIELLRLRNCADAETGCEISGMYPVINGEIVEFTGFDANGVPKYIPVTSILFYTWDTYFQKRFFKIEGCGGKLFNHPFESSSITDYWGENCGSCGRLHVTNENAEQRWHPVHSIKSDDFVNDGGYNGLGTFRESNVKVFKGQHWGSVVAVRAINSILAFICTNDWFLTDYNLNYLRVTNTGVVIANLDEALGEPRQKIGEGFGCSLENKGAIIFLDAYVSWPDNKNLRTILMDFQSAYDISKIDNSSYFMDKFNFINKFNSSLAPDEYENNLIDIIQGYDPAYHELIYTFRPRRNFTDKVSSFINDERETFQNMQETFVYNIDLKKWTRFTGYAPESYGLMSKAKTGKELLSFIKGIPYRHNSNDVFTSNTFYGVKTQSVLRIIYNESKDKVKILQKVTVNSNEHKHIITDITSDEINAFSYTPPAYLKKKENVWYTEVLRDMSSYPSALPQDAFMIMLFDGKRLFGRFFDITIVSDLQKLDEYCELDEIAIHATGSELSDK